MIIQCYVDGVCWHLWLVSGLNKMECKYQSLLFFYCICALKKIQIEPMPFVVWIGCIICNNIGFSPNDALGWLICHLLRVGPWLGMSWRKNTHAKKRVRLLLGPFCRHRPVCHLEGYLQRGILRRGKNWPIYHGLLPCFTTSQLWQVWVICMWFHLFWMFDFGWGQTEWDCYPLCIRGLLGYMVHGLNLEEC